MSCFSSQQCLRLTKKLVIVAEPKEEYFGFMNWMKKQEAEGCSLLIVPQVLLLLLQLLGNGLCSSQATGDWVEGIKLSSYIGDAKGGVVDGECFQLK